MVQIGDKLPNGAIIIDMETKAPNDALVLCVMPGRSFDRYIAWRMDPRAPDSTVSGVYLSRLEHAVVAFNERAGR